MNLLTTHFPTSSRYFCSLRSKYFPITLFSNTLNERPFFNVRDNVSNPYKTTDKNVLSRIFNP